MLPHRITAALAATLALTASVDAEPSRWGFTCSRVRELVQSLPAEQIAAIKAQLTPEQISAARSCLHPRHRPKYSGL